MKVPGFIDPTAPRLRRRRSERGYALLGFIVALTVMAVGMGVAIPDAQVQARRELEIEMMWRGEQMAEAIARYYSGGGKVPPAGLVVKSPPPPYGYLTELKKLRDGVNIGTEEIFLVRKSAYIDPLTGEEWEPIRIGDPRLRKYFRAWVQATGRQLPPIYASYMGGSAIVDTTPKPADGQPDDDEDDELDDEDDEDFDEDDEDEDLDEDEEEDEEDGARLQDSGNSPFVNVAFAQETPRRVEPTRRDPSASVFGNTRSTGPIIGVVSKARGKSVRTRFGMNKYEEMIFVYIPPAPVGVVPGAQTGLPATTPGTGEQAPTGGTDSDGDGIPDGLEPQQPPKP